MNTVSTDGPEVTEDEAIEHCLHHLRLASMFYEATPKDPVTTRKELNRLAQRGVLKDRDVWVRAAAAFLTEVEDYYSESR